MQAKKIIPLFLINYPFTEEERIEAELKIFKYYPSGTILLKKIDHLLANTIPVRFIQDSNNKIKLKYFISETYYDTLFECWYNQLKDQNDNEYMYNFYSYQSNLSKVKNIKQYYALSRRYAIYRTNKFYEYFPGLKNNLKVGEPIIYFILNLFHIMEPIDNSYFRKILSDQRKYLPGKLYSAEM